MRLIIGLLSSVFFMATCALADTVVGLPADPGGGNCFPFGCAYNAEYQQVYTSSAFSGPITITGLEFFNTQSNSHSTSLPSGTFTIDLSTTTTADWNTLSGTFGSNVGADNAQVFSGSIAQPWTFGDTLTITLSTPFSYNPADGNLLMDVVGSGVSIPGGPTYFDVNSTDSTVGRVYCSGGIACSTGSVENNYGLVTDFVSSTSPVPEPSSIPLAAAFAGLMVAIRRRFRAQ